LETGFALTATANGQTQSYAAANAVDGNLNTYWEGAGSGQDELTLTLAQAAAPASLTLRLNPATVWSKRNQTFSVLCSADGTSFEELLPSAEYAFDPDTGNSVEIALPGQNLAAIKIVFLKNTGAAGAQVAEVVLK